MKNIIKIIFLTSISICTTYAYEAQQGKIDMHGGNSDSLTKGSALNMAMGLGSVLSKKDSVEEKKEEKNFIKIDNIENIKKEDLKKND